MIQLGTELYRWGMALRGKWVVDLEYKHKVGDTGSFKRERRRVSTAPLVQGDKG